MSTNKQFSMNKGMSYKVTAKARGYYDYSTILSPDGTAITYDMTPYDGLNYNVDLTYNAYRDATIDFSKTKLPYLGLVNQSLQTSEYCLRATGQNYDLKEYASKYTNVTVHGSPTIDNDVVSNFSSDNYLTIEKRSNTMTVVLKIITGSDLDTPQRILFLDKWVSFTLDGGAFRVENFGEGTEGPIGLDLSANTEYVWKFVLNSDGSRVFSYSTDGGTNYTEAANFTDTGVNWSDSQANTFYLGIRNTSAYPLAFKGKFDLSKSYIMEKLASGDFVGYNLNETTFESTGTTKSYAGIYDPDYTDTGTAKTLNCFSNGNQFVVLSEKENYQNYTYLGTVTIPQHKVFAEGGVTPNPYPTPINPSALKFGDRIDNKATVVGTYDSNDGKTYVYAVLDAQYRGANIAWSTGLYDSDIDTGLPNYESFAPLSEQNHESATYNTDFIINNYSDKKIEAFTFVRNVEPLTHNGKTYKCQLPNAYELLQIFNKKTELDALDPTAEANSTKKIIKLGIWK